MERWEILSGREGGVKLLFTQMNSGLPQKLETNRKLKIIIIIIKTIVNKHFL